VILPETGAEEARTVAQRIRAASRPSISPRSRGDRL